MIDSFFSLPISTEPAWTTLFGWAAGAWVMAKT
jgi:hypothetical protein